MTMFWLCIVSLVINSVTGLINPANYTSACTDLNHLLLAPGVLTSGGSSRACISRFYVDGPARFVINLDTEDGKTAVFWRELPPGDGGCLDVLVPQLPNTKAVLNVQLSYPEAYCTWHTHMKVRISSGRFITIHTERAKYRPGEIVRIRAFILKADLTPTHGLIDEIWLEGPLGAWEGIRSAQWLRTKIRLGIAQVQHELDELAPGGRWTVRAKMADGAQGFTTFLVGNYELPPFQLSVKHSPLVLRSSERLVWNVCVRYPWTEAVEGMLVIRLRGAGSSSSLDSSPGIRTAVRLKAPKACHRHAAASRRIGLNGINPPDIVVADFSFQEEGTRVWQNTTVVSRVVDKLISLEFLSKDRVVIAPGLPYKLKVKATRFDDKPSINVPLRICHHPSTTSDLINILSSNGNSPTICENSITDGKGVARIMFTAEDRYRYYHFQAFLSNDSTTASPPFLITVQSSSASAAFGPMKIDPNSVKSFVPLYLNVKGNMAVTAHFVVITRGGIIYRWGATTQCPLSTPNQILNVHRNTNCQSPSPLETITIDPEPTTINSSELSDYHLPRIMLPVKISHQMCPDSHLVAYFYYEGELVSASKHFEMEECFGKVETNWSSHLVAPGSTASLHIATPGPALCAVTALDFAARWVTPTPTVGGIMMEGLRRLVDGNKNLTQYDVAGECFLTSDSPNQPINSNDLLATWLSAAGVRLTGGYLQTTRCDIKPPSTMLDVDNRPRSDFSEAWLWKLVPVGSGGSAMTSSKVPHSITRYEAFVTCLSRTGVAVSTPSVLQVFREFFIHLDTTKKLRRGDSTIIKYRLFNYLYEKLCVTMNLHPSSHITLEVTTESICIEPRSCISRRVVGTAVRSGEATISVEAKGQRKGAEISDEVLVQISIELEGVPVHEQRSIMLCGKDNPDSTKSHVTWEWTAVHAVPNTESITMWAAGDITAPLLASSDSLVTLPRGCGEQNLARLATNLVALDQLDPSCTAYAVAKMHVARGFTRQLQYVHSDGGFSAFGGSDSTPSTWLTAFAVRYLRRAYKILSPGSRIPPSIERAEQWLVGQQMENGCFRNEGQVFHRELKGGLTDEGSVASVALTAYVVSSLVQSTIILPSKILRNTIHCLRALPPQKTKNKIYATALIANAISNIKNYEEELNNSNDAEMYRKETAGLERDEDIWKIIELLKVAKKKEDYVWWETETLSTSIEATGLALSTISSCPPSIQSRCEASARGAARWLAANMQSEGGFMTTQDTLVALEALAKWSSSQPSNSNLTVTVASGAWYEKLDLPPGVNVPSVLNVPVGKQMKVNVQGSGCVVVQATRSYHTLSVNESSSHLTVQVSVQTDGSFDCSADRCFCAAVVEACALWTSEFPEMAVLEVNLPAGYGADAAKLYSQLNQHSMVRRIELTRSGNKATFYLTSTEMTAGHYCIKVHAVGPQVSTTPASVRILDYYNPTRNDTKMFTIPEDCPSPISHENEEYLRTDNLFNKAKSLTDDDPIISQELTFEDIPEGIPLDDPMYDNLTKDNDSYTESDKVQNESEGNKPFTNKEENDKQDSVTNTYNKDSYYVDVNNTPMEYKIETNRMPSKINNINETIKQKIESITQIKPAIDNKVVIKTQESYNEMENVSDKKELRLEENKVFNPEKSDFHVIDSEKDLDVPTGVEGPVPVYMLPPEGFVVPPIDKGDQETREASTREPPELLDSSRQIFFHQGQHYGYYI